MRALFLPAAIAVLLAGCTFMSPSMRRALATPYKPVNVSIQATLPESIRRVALLPVPAAGRTPTRRRGWIRWSRCSSSS